MNKIGYIFDSTAIIDEEIVKKYDISFVSLNLIIEGNEHKANTLDEAKFKNEFLSYKSVKSASPSPHDFEKAIRAKLDKGYEEVIVVTLSSKISATYNTALIARDTLTDEEQARVFVHDSLYGSIGFDALVDSMKDVLASDMSAKEVVSELEKRRPESVVLFELNDLKHLFKGGRLNALKYFFSAALQIKPVVEFRDGVLDVVTKNRSRAKNLEFIYGQIDRFVKNFKHVFVNIFSYDTEDGAYLTLKKTICEKWPQVVLNFTKRICPVFMTHVGVKGYALSVVSYN